MIEPTIHVPGPEKHGRCPRVWELLAPMTKPKRQDTAYIDYSSSPHCIIHSYKSRPLHQMSWGPTLRGP